jgi:Zn finger protein HypA/HybF involved in hydrogenase expression
MPIKKDTTKLSNIEGKFWLRCRNCRHVWYPDARKWRDNETPKEKTLRCPKCNVKNRVPNAIMQYFVVKIKHETEYGCGELPT